MAYSRTTWKNNETKLNQDNLNNIEDGIEEAKSAVVTAQTAAEAAQTAANEAKSAASALETKVKANTQDIEKRALKTDLNALTETVSGKSTVKVDSTGEATAEVQYITVDGTEYKLAGGNDKVNYAEYTELDLDTMFDTGIYKVGSCTNGPAASEAGLLKVQKLNDELAEQEWISATNLAFRLNKNSEAKHFYISVDGADEYETAQGELALEYGHYYVVHGELNGSIRFTAKAGEELPTHSTKIVLKGVTIYSEKDYAIDYPLEDKKLIVELYGDTYNFLIVNDKVTSGAKSSTGTIHSDNNLLVYGTGYLSIKAIKGHGLKASEMIFEGIPHVYIESYHDGIHGSKTLKVFGGTYYIKAAKDAVGFGDAQVTNNNLEILGGKWIIGPEVRENAFDTPLDSGNKIIIGADIKLDQEFSEDFPAFRSNIKVTDTVTLSGIGAEGITTVALANSYGTPIVRYDSGAATAVNKVFTVDASITGDITMSGNFSGYKVVFNRTLGAKANVFLNGIYYVDDSDDTEAFISYNDSYDTKKRIKFETSDGAINYLKKANGTIIKSATNVQFDNKGDIICDCANGIAVDAENGYILLGNDGCRIISSIKANSVRIGKDIEDVIDEKYSIADTAIYVKDTMITVPATSYSVEAYRKMLLAPQYFDGCAIFYGNMSYASTPITDVKFEAQKGQIILTDDAGDETGETYYNEACVYAKTCNYAKTNIATYTEPKEYNPDFPDAEAKWTYVHSVVTDFYSKAEVDDKTAELNALIDNLTARVKALEDDKGTLNPVVSDDNLSLSNITVNAEDLNLENKATVLDTDLKLN